MSCCDGVTVVTTTNQVTVIPSETVVNITTGGGGGGGAGTTVSFVRVAGSSFSGSSGGFGRTYTASSDVLDNSVSITGRVLDSTSQYTIAGALLTINTELWNDDYVVFAINT